MSPVLDVTVDSGGRLSDVVMTSEVDDSTVAEPDVLSDVVAVALPLDDGPSALDDGVAELSVAEFVEEDREVGFEVEARAGRDVVGGAFGCKSLPSSYSTLMSSRYALVVVNWAVPVTVCSPSARPARLQTTPHAGAREYVFTSVGAPLSNATLMAPWSGREVITTCTATPRKVKSNVAPLLRVYIVSSPITHTDEFGPPPDWSPGMKSKTTGPSHVLVLGVS